mmetsp:Transcript_20320/g.56322  ORF Transcript_20320/g.56322 Transcript_20320/m.56322 type:complete len:269 (-) Transcript_20320:82-888(-)
MLLWADLTVNELHLLLQDIRHAPGRLDARNLHEEVPERLGAPLGVHHLGVVLKPEHLLLQVLDGHNGALLALADSIKALWQLHALVSVAHPHVVGVVGGVREELAALLDKHGHAPVLAASNTSLHLAPEGVHEELHAIADAENRDLLLRNILEEPLRQPGGALHMDGVGTARQDDHIGVEALYALQGSIARDELGGDAQLAHAAGNELGVLATIVQHEAQIVLADELGGAVGLGLLGCWPAHPCGRSSRVTRCSTDRGCGAPSAFLWK